MKTAISIPDPVFDAAERLAHQLGISRSRLYTEAVQRFVTEHRREDVTNRLNALYSDDPARVDPHLQTLQVTSINIEDW